VSITKTAGFFSPNLFRKMGYEILKMIKANVHGQKVMAIADRT